MKWYPVELHTHTEHSDGDFTVAGLVHAAKDRGFTAVALTDHNTASGLAEFAPALAREGLTGVAGIEWTTYFGHMLVLGEQGYTDWRGVRPGQIDEAIAAIHENHGVVGIAHPFALSNPINTGYHWEFQVSDWTAVDFLEVWSRDDAPCKIQSLRAFALWEQLLNRGCRITATSGRDWHREDHFAYAHTYVGLSEPLLQDAILQAVRDGHICLAAGPLLTMRGTDAASQSWDIGDEVSPGLLSIDLSVDADTLPHDWDRAQIHPEKLRLVHNGQIVWEGPMQPQQTVSLDLSDGWLRADLIGTYYGRTGQHLAFTNPLFIHPRR